MVEAQTLISQQPLSCGVGIERGEDLVQQSLIADHSGRRSLWACDERQGREPVSQRKDRLLSPCTRVALVERDDPDRVRVLAAHADHWAWERSPLALGIRLRRPNPEANALLPHQV